MPVYEILKSVGTCFANSERFAQNLARRTPRACENFENFLNNPLLVNLYIHAVCCAAAWSMTGGNYEKFFNNPIQVNFYIPTGM